jgi:hypothetical protein
VGGLLYSHREPNDALRYSEFREGSCHQTIRHPWLLSERFLPRPEVPRAQSARLRREWLERRATVLLASPPLRRLPGLVLGRVFAAWKP